jgi:AcrR family transcriptional regulator
MPKTEKPRDLREACVEEAFAIVGELGVEGLSIREVARRLRVSHQAPYKHFPSSDHLLAEIARRAFARFAQSLDARPRTGHPAEDMRALGMAYFEFAHRHPAHYRLMFGGRLPDPREHPEMLREAKHAFGILLGSVRDLHGGRASERDAQLDALFVWATVHGLATILETRALAQTGLPEETLRDALPHTLDRIGRAMGERVTADPEPLTKRSTPPGRR